MACCLPFEELTHEGEAALSVKKTRTEFVVGTTSRTATIKCHYPDTCVPKTIVGNNNFAYKSAYRSKISH